MKKLIFSAVAGIVLCAAAFTGYKVYENQTMSPQDILIAKNLEALTQNEDGWITISCSMACLYDYNYDCSFTYFIPDNYVEVDPDGIRIPMECPMMRPSGPYYYN